MALWCDAMLCGDDAVVFAESGGSQALCSICPNCTPCITAGRRGGGRWRPGSSLGVGGCR